MIYFYENRKIMPLLGGILPHFVKYRLEDEGIDKIMMLFGEKILKSLLERETQIHFTSTGLQDMNPF
jgi:hypothetical protein